MPNPKITEIFTYHPPFGTQVERYGKIRDRALDLATLIQILTPPSREQSTAITRLQEVMMWANAAIAINEKPVLGSSEQTAGTEAGPSASNFASPMAGAFAGSSQESV